MTTPVNPPPAQPLTAVLNFLRKNWPWVGPLIYVYVTAVGMVQAWLQYKAFGVNIFEFSEVNDFLLAALREPISFLAVFGLVAYGGLGILLSHIFTKRREGRSTPGSKLPALYRTQQYFYYFVLILMIIGAPYLAPRFLHQGYGAKWKESLLSDTKRTVHVQLKDVKITEGPEGWIQSIVLIGITSKFVFLYVPQTKRMLIVPVANLVAMAKE